MVSIENFSKYKISKNGDIFSFTKKSNGKKLNQHSHRCGYKFVWLHRDDGKRKQMFVHRLVALAYIENEFGKKEINHLDLDKTNNNIENLEWCTRSENMRHLRKNIKTSKKQIDTAKKMGEKWGKINGSKVKYSDEYFQAVKKLRDKGFSFSKIAKELKIGIATAYRLSKGVRR